MADSKPPPLLPPARVKVSSVLRCARPKRPFLAMVVACAMVCWLMLVQTFQPARRPTTLLSRASGGFDSADAAFPAPPEGSPPRPDAWRALSEGEVSSLSRLGRFLFLNDTKDMHPQSKTFTILIWKHGKLLERRHILQLKNEKHNPFENCSVSNCRLSYEDNDLSSADAVIFHLHQTKGPKTLPVRNKTHENQRWIFLSDESPYNTFMHGRPNNSMAEYPGIFNWSMNYRLDADVPVPYGRTVPLTEAEAAAAASVPGGVARNYARGKSRVAAIMGSNCGASNGRWDYVKKLQKYMQVDVYGRCGPLKCSGHFYDDCPALGEYKFYLAFENANCKDYVTEKVWWNAYKNDAVPVIMGVSKENCNKLLPPHSYLHSADFASPADLARFILYLNQSDRDYNSYFQWKYQYKILNEHGYFKVRSYHYCRVCEALNYNDPSPKVYEHPETVWNVKDHCF